MTYNEKPRRRFSAKQREAFLSLHEFRCHWCLGRIKPGQDWQIEHVIARELMGDGSDDDSNLRPIHARPCHVEKTKLDRRMIAKSNHVRRAHGIDPDTRKWQPVKMRSRPFPKVKRPMQSRSWN